MKYIIPSEIGRGYGATVRPLYIHCTTRKERRSLILKKMVEKRDDHYSNLMIKKIHRLKKNMKCILYKKMYMHKQIHITYFIRRKVNYTKHVIFNTLVDKDTFLII